MPVVSVILFVPRLFISFISGKEDNSNFLISGKDCQVMADESEIYPYPGVARLFVWKYFGFKKGWTPIKQNLDMDTVNCKLCRKSYSNKGKLKYDSCAPRSDVHTIEKILSNKIVYLRYFLDKNS